MKPQHVNPGMDTTISPVIIDDSFRSVPARQPHLIDTPDPYRHCDHEDYCYSYQMKLINHIPEGWACPYPCKHDARPHTSPPAPAQQKMCGDGSCLRTIEPYVKRREACAAKAERKKVLDALEAWAHKATRESKAEWGQIPYGWILVEIESLRARQEPQP